MIKTNQPIQLFNRRYILYKICIKVLRSVNKDKNLTFGLVKSPKDIESLNFTLSNNIADHEKMLDMF